MKTKSVHLISGRSGQAMVEMALVLPILLVVVFGTCEFGNAWLENNTVTSAAREAARVAAVSSPYSVAAANAVARNVLAAAGVPAANIVSIDFIGPAAANNQITVNIQVRYNSIIGGFIPGVNGILLTGSTTMRWEG